MQNLNVPDTLKSPALTQVTDITNGFITINLGGQRTIDCIGIGNTDGSRFSLNGGAAVIDYTDDGLYLFPNPITVSSITLTTNATFVGRIGLGRAMGIPTSPRKEFSYRSTDESRTTLGGQVVFGMGGYEYRTVSLDSRYQITKEIIREISDGYRAIGKGYPFFINFEDEMHKLPFERLYAIERDQKNFSFESGINRFLYSRRWNFDERF